MDADAVREYVKGQIAYLSEHRVQASEIGDDQPLFSDGGDATENLIELDSLDAFELALALEDEYNFGAPEDVDLTQFRTVNDIVEFVVELLSRKPSVHE